jgi:hypothetical protein
MRVRLPKGTKRVCPTCRGEMWVVDGVVEDHGDGYYKTCAASGMKL